MNGTRDRRRILLAVTLSEWGGAQSYVYQVARAARERYDVTVLCGPGGSLRERLRSDEVHVVEVPALRRNLDPARDAAALLQMARLLRRERFDLVHLNSTKAGILGRLAARLSGVPVVLFTAHGWAFTEGRSSAIRWLLAQTERLAAALTTRIICVSEHDRGLAVRFGVAPPEQIVVIHNGVDPAPFLHPTGEIGRSTLGVGDGPTIAMVGRLAPPKDPFFLLDACRMLPAGNIVIVGDGPMRTRVAAAAWRNGLAGRVHLLGFRMDVPRLLRACDIFVLSSRWEGLPLAVIEAMMAGLPVVATQVGGVPELVEDGVTGFLVPLGDARALAEALRGLMNDRALRRRMGEAGRRRALERFTAERMVQETMALYDSVLGSGIDAASPLVPRGPRREAY